MQENIQTPKLELIKNSRTFKMVIPPAVEEKIRLACASVPNLEWSGVLFFKYKGSFENDDLLVTCKDIHLLPIQYRTLYQCPSEECPYKLQEGHHFQMSLCT